MFGLSELGVILVVVAVVLGFKKLPELTRSAGKAARIFKSEAKALKEQDPAPAATGTDGTNDTNGRVVSGTVVGQEDSSPRS
ncbi:twin-arginine translocase TatA/TatE family subunit [Streptomyces naphthomycinicus]|uniref:twin-arginine translocase TatA/TatE family subunit n=1 Tax=Streptomyces naphthomycinicus TaxID=2872625 RepID=UPI001CEC30E8|nr:twin-arginine translocase TatA/TatE family subunit [Streptomyces sp. TML10]